MHSENVFATSYYNFISFALRGYRFQSRLKDTQKKTCVLVFFSFITRFVPRPKYNLFFTSFFTLVFHGGFTRDSLGIHWGFGGTR